MAFCRASSLFYPPRVRHFTHRGSLWTASCRSRLPFLFAGVSSVVVIYFLLPNSSPSLPTLTAKALSPSYFVPATLVGSIQTSPDTKLLTLSLSPEVVPQNSTPIWSVCIKDDDIQVERHYTPLEGIDKNGNMLFWIKKYQHGEVSRWLHSKQPGSRIEVRGPLQTWSWKDGIWEEIIMISGGTGITPFYQLLHSVFSSNKSMPNTRFTLLHASKTFADLPPTMMAFLSDLAQQKSEKFKLRVFVDALEGSPEARPPGNFNCGRIGRSALEEVLEPSNNRPWWRPFWSPAPPIITPERKVLVLVCGPEQMMNAIAGPYGPNYSQGQVAGILGQVGLQSHQVWKF